MANSYYSSAAYTDNTAYYDQSYSGYTESYPAQYQQQQQPPPPPQQQQPQQQQPQQQQSSYQNSYYNYQPGYQHDYQQNSYEANYNYGGGYGYDQSYGVSYQQQPIPTVQQPQALVSEHYQAESNDQKLVFPVSCGVKHKQNAEGYVPKRPAIPPEVMSKMAIAKSRLEIKPNDPKALAQLNAAMRDYHSFQEDKQRSYLDSVNNAKGTGYDGPGQFTGQPLVEPMDKVEIDSDDYRTFARPDMFSNLKPVKDGYGKLLMKKMGWREGKPLGNHGKGSLAPIEITVKIDRKGLMNDMECIRRKPEGVAKNDGPNWICKLTNGKNPVSGLGEIHQSLGIPSPIFEMVGDDAVGGTYKWKVKTSWGSFTPFKGCRSKKQAKSQCAYNALREILKAEAERIGVEPPTEAKDSCFLRTVFVPSNKTATGQNMLYKHFYKGGELININDRFGEHFNNDQAFNARAQRLTKDQRNVIKAAESRPEKAQGMLTGPNWMVKVINGKNAASALLELCQVMSKPTPEEYGQYINRQHFITLTTPWGTYTPPEGDRIRKDARKKASYYAIQQILKNEANKYAMAPPIENSDSTDDCISYIAS